MIRSLRRCFFGGAFLFLAVACCFAADETTKWEIARFSDDVAALVRASNSTTVTATDVLVLDDEESYVFDASVKAVHTRYLVYKVLTKQGAEQWGGVSFGWEPWHEERPEVRARVITPDNAVHELDPKTISDAPAKEDEVAVYSDRRVVRAPLPAMAPGSVVEEEETTTESVSFPGAGTVKRLFFGGRGVPVQRTRLLLDAPASFPLRYNVQLLPDLKPERKEANGRVQLAFEYGPMGPIEDSGQYLPNETPPYPEVNFSTGSSWQQIAESYQRIVDRQIANADVKQIDAKLLAGKKSREDKATAILQYLDREIRYTGVEFGQAAITPHSPAETLKHKYGDCKDKAALLVAMLRAAGIPAYVALLNVGWQQDVARDLPGMGSFDHAIVYAPGNPDIWIDATDDHARLGQLPSPDQGRLALIARSATDSLTMTPVASSTDNVLRETREFYLSENGPARIVEISVPHGAMESRYRSAYGDPENKDRKKELTNYVKAQYLAEKLDRIEPSDPGDISKQFTLKLECSGAKRASTDLESAAAAIRLDTLFNSLPAELRTHESHKDDEKEAEPVKLKSKKIRTADYQLAEAFATEWDYKIVPPPGFRPKPLPPNAKVSAGPALLTEEFSADKDGAIRAMVRFDSVKRRFSPSEAAEMRDKVAQLLEGEAILLYFEPIAQALLNEGKFRESFQTYRSLIALHPQEAVHHLQLAKALLSAGMGEVAREEARLAVKLEPNSALAEKTLADILEYDLVGRRFRPGSDYASAEAALRAAEKLDVDDKTIPADLAILLEYNSDGDRYGPGARLAEATAAYNSLTPEQLANVGVKNNPAFTLFYEKKFAEARKYAESLNPQLSNIIVASTTALDGSQAGITEARRRTGGEADLKQLLKNAGDLLMRARQYPQAADLLEAGASGDNTSNTMNLASLLRKARPKEGIHYGNDPAGIAMQRFVLLSASQVPLEKMLSLSSRNAQAVIKRTDPDDLKRTWDDGRQTRRGISLSGYSPDMMLDISLAESEAKAEGDDVSGYRVAMKIPGKSDLKVYVVKEDGKYLILDTSEKPSAIGLEVLDRLEAHDLKGARVLLDWARDDQHLAGGDDPLAGKAFPRLWTKGKEGDENQIRNAAAAILVQTRATAEQGIAILESARKSVTNEPERLNLTLGILEGYSTLDQAVGLEHAAAELAAQYPESKRSFSEWAWALRNLGKNMEADALAEDWLKKFPDDADGWMQLVNNALVREDYVRAHDLGLKIVHDGKANYSDLNRFSWFSIFAGMVGDEDISNAAKAAQDSQNAAYILHTLGCLYAEVGKVKEAREVLIQAMDKAGLDEPNDAYWYAFGRIAEQYGENEVARADYERVKKPKYDISLPGSSYRLAQNRLKAMNDGAAKKPASTK
jgi:transglutaminase-like putative cysteine protease/tetratricopeptide (TPR) repeat protein